MATLPTLPDDSGAYVELATWVAEVQQYLIDGPPNEHGNEAHSSVFITAAEAPVQSVNGSTGNVVLEASDVGAYPTSNPDGFVDAAGAAAAAPVQSVDGRTGAVDLSDAYAASDDPRLSDERTPTDGSVTDAKVASDAAIAQSKVDGLTTDLAAKVALTGDQTVAGVKTFTSSPIVPAPTADMQAATKKYVDDNAGGGGGGDPAWLDRAIAWDDFQGVADGTNLDGRVAPSGHTWSVLAGTAIITDGYVQLESSDAVRTIAVLGDLALASTDYPNVSVVMSRASFRARGGPAFASTDSKALIGTWTTNGDRIIHLLDAAGSETLLADSRVGGTAGIRRSPDGDFNAWFEIGLTFNLRADPLAHLTGDPQEAGPVTSIGTGPTTDINLPGLATPFTHSDAPAIRVARFVVKAGR